MIAHSEWKHDDVFEARAENGNTIVLDADAAHAHGPSPMEAVLMALCSCTSVDVVVGAANDELVHIDDL